MKTSYTLTAIDFVGDEYKENIILFLKNYFIL